MNANFYQFLKEHWLNLQTNITESLFTALGTESWAYKRFKQLVNATRYIGKMLLIAEQRFRELDASEGMQEVCLVRSMELEKIKQEK